MNRKRHPDYFILRNKINACRNHGELENLRQVTVETNKLFKGTKWAEDGVDLMVIFMRKEAEFESLTDIAINKLIESRHHQKLFYKN